MLRVLVSTIPAVHSRFRAGQRFEAEPVEISVSEDDFAALVNDPFLCVQAVEDSQESCEEVPCIPALPS